MSRRMGDRTSPLPAGRRQFSTSTTSDKSSQQVAVPPRGGGSSLIPESFTQLLDNHGDTLQQMALMAYLKDEDAAKPYLQAITAARVWFAQRI